MTIDGSGRTRPSTKPMLPDDPGPAIVDENGHPVDNKPTEDTPDVNPFVGGSPPLPDGSTDSTDGLITLRDSDNAIG